MSQHSKSKRIERDERDQVRAQPHRKGDRSQMTDTFGHFMQFVMADQATRCYEAGNIYTRLVSNWRRAKGIPQRTRIEAEAFGPGELSDEVVADWGKLINRCDNAMKCSGMSAFSAAKLLILEDLQPPVKLFGPVQRAIMQLAIELGMCG